MRAFLAKLRSSIGAAWSAARGAFIVEWRGIEQLEGQVGGPACDRIVSELDTGERVTFEPIDPSDVTIVKQRYYQQQRAARTVRTTFIDSRGNVRGTWERKRKS
jgi:hypothetical protein